MSKGKLIRVAMVQMNPVVGDIEGNAARIAKYIGEAKRAGAHLVAFPELAITGYPPEDLLLKPRFVSANLEALKKVSRAAKGICAIVGFVDRDVDIYNAAAVIYDGKVADVYRKIYLPNYGVFDEFRYFQAGSRVPVYKMGGVTFGVNICEDVWYPEGPARLQPLAGAELIININASPYTVGKQRARERMLAARATDSVVAIAYLNMVGGQDEIVFDGQSVVVDASGAVIAKAPAFEEAMLITDIELGGVAGRRVREPKRRQNVLVSEEAGDCPVVTLTSKALKAPAKAIKATDKKKVKESTEEEVYKALSMGLADYMRKNGFDKGAIIGLSGGIDSALVATIAADALGPKKVTCVFMPSKYTSRESREDSVALAKALGVRLVELPIWEVYAAYMKALAPEFKGMKPDTTEENLQARIRGMLLMAMSNKTGAIVLTTGNKSEMSVGYATLYGDMAGGFAVIKDVPKTLVYRLSKWRNKGGAVIPRRIITKAPTAELRPDQKDTDSLPPYDELDPILAMYIEQELSFDEIVRQSGSRADVVRRVIGMVDRSEYKRRQSPPGIKITERAFGRDWRVPITNRYKP